MENNLSKFSFWELDSQTDDDLAHVKYMGTRRLSKTKEVAVFEYYGDLRVADYSGILKQRLQEVKYGDWLYLVYCKPKTYQPFTQDRICFIHTLDELDEVTIKHNLNIRKIMN